MTATTERPFPLIGAHTGCDGTPYNTIESFLKGVNLRADIVEVDLRTCRDGTVILLHDDCPYIHEYGFEQLNRLPLRSQLGPVYERHELVRLTDILPLAFKHRVRLNLDIKTPEAIEPVIRLVKRHEAEGQVFVTGTSDGIAAAHRDIRVVFNTPTKLTPESSDYASYARQLCDEMVRGMYYGLNMHVGTCLPEAVELAHERGLAVWVYTVNDEETMRRMIRFGVDAITTKNVAGLIDLKEKDGNFGANRL